MKQIILAAMLPLSCAQVAYSECVRGDKQILEDIAAHNNAILVGELHGTKEMPQEFLRIVEQLSKGAENVVVALKHRAANLKHILRP